MGEGVEYLLADSQPPHLFILRKMYRHALGAITTLAFYYILDGSIYQAPPLQAALLARMVRSCRGAAGPEIPSLHGTRGVARIVAGVASLQHACSTLPCAKIGLSHAASTWLPLFLFSCCSSLVSLLQQRCIFCIKGAFKDMQQDLSPLSQLVAAQAGQGQQQSALDRELAAGRDVARPVTAADREQQQRVEANVRHVLRQVNHRGDQDWGLLACGRLALWRMGQREHPLRLTHHVACPPALDEAPARCLCLACPHVCSFRCLCPPCCWRRKQGEGQALHRSCRTRQQWTARAGQQRTQEQQPAARPPGRLRCLRQWPAGCDMRHVRGCSPRLLLVGRLLCLGQRVVTVLRQVGCKC